MSTIANAIKKLENRDITAAKRLFNKAIQEGTFFSTAHAGLALCLIHEKNIPSAKLELEKAGEQGEQSFLNYIARGYVLDSEGKTEEAERSFIQATQTKPKSAYAYITYGSFLLVHENNEDGIWMLLQAKKLGGNTWWVNRNLAIAYLQTRKSYKAIGASILSWISKPSKEGMNLVLTSSYKAMLIFLMVLFGVGIFFLFRSSSPLLGFGIMIGVSTGAELVIYLKKKERGDLILLFVLLFFLILWIYLNFFK